MKTHEPGGANFIFGVEVRSSGGTTNGTTNSTNKLNDNTTTTTTVKSPTDVKPTTKTLKSGTKGKGVGRGKPAVSGGKPGNTGGKPGKRYECVACGASYPDQTLVINHMMDNHTVENPTEVDDVDVGG